MALPRDPARRHAAVARAFGERVAAVVDWNVPTPVADWTARDVVGHLLGWLPGFLAGGSGHRLPPGPAVERDPSAAWRHQADAVQRILEDRVAASSAFQHPAVPAQSLAEAINAFYTTDVLLHTWDLARATGQDDRLDPEACAEVLAGIEPVEELMRASGQYGPRVTVPEDAPAQERLLGFIGRDPRWSP